jgi:hypothetical protein
MNVRNRKRRTVLWSEEDGIPAANKHKRAISEADPRSEREVEGEGGGGRGRWREREVEGEGGWAAPVHPGDGDSEAAQGNNNDEVVPNVSRYGRVRHAPKKTL